MPYFIPFLSGFVGIIAAAVYLKYAEMNLPPNPGGKRELPPLHGVEAFIILISASVMTGHFLYWCFGEREQIKVLRAQFGGGYAVLLKLVGVLALGASVARRLAAGKALAVSDAVSLGVAALLLLWAFATWYHSGSDDQNDPPHDYHDPSPYFGSPVDDAR